MTESQNQAALTLYRALRACRRAKLRRLVLDGVFYVWPSDANPQADIEIMGTPAALEKHGQAVKGHDMELEGATL
jgi:hypothetical protein